MSELTLFDIHQGQPVTYAKVTVDPRCQHITLLDADGGHGAFADFGIELHWWSMSALHLDANGARDLGKALIDWADRRKAVA